MNWKFWEQKQNPAGRAIILGLNVTGPGPVKHVDFERLANASYGRNATVYACVSVLATAAAKIPWTMLRLSTGGSADIIGARNDRRLYTKNSYLRARARALDTARFPGLAKTLAQAEVNDHPLLRLLEKPNPSQGQFEFFEQLLSYWLVSGNCFQWFATTQLSGKQPQEMWNLRPDRTTVVPAKINDVERMGIVGGYHYQVNSDPRSGEDFDPSSVIHHKFFHPTNDWYGMSPLQAAIRDWETNNLMADWNYALVKQGARPGGALVVPTTIDDDVYERLKADIEGSYSGAHNAGRPLLLTGGIKWEQMGLSPMELDYVTAMTDSETRICRAFKVPPETIGDARSKNYNSYPEARSALYHEGVLPLVERLRDAFNAYLVPLYGDGLYLDYDRDQIEAIQEDEAKRWTRLGAAKFLTTNEKRVAAGYDTSSEPLADTPEFLVNPAPGATGIAPAGGTLKELEGAVRVKRIERDPETKLALRIIDEIPDEELRLKLERILQEKAQNLNAEQQRAQRKLRILFSKHFGKMGPDLVAHLRKALE